MQSIAIDDDKVRNVFMEMGKFNKRYSLTSMGINGTKSLFYNLNEAALMQKAIERSEGVLGIGGTLLVETGKHTGRSPKDKYVVENSGTENKVWWEKNGRMSPENFDKLHGDMLSHMKNKDYFVQDLYACADPEFQLNVRLINELAWHGLFIRHLLRRPNSSEVNEFIPEFTIINCPSFKADPKTYNIRSETVIAINFDKKLVLVGGTEYAGENKKGVFTLLNYLLPEKDVMPMHCSANHGIGDEDDVAIFFGLSGTGKTTLSQDPKRILIGDDEHGWSDSGVFNFEGGCYAKTINLSPDAEPEIFSTMNKFSTVIENMRYDSDSLELDYEDDSLTPNMRSAYPLEFISNTSRLGRGGLPKNIIFLTCDAFGVFPPIAELSPEQAIYHFLSGFTSKAPGTERGIVDPEPTFSACFAAPFLPLRPEVYGELLKEKIVKGNAKCWLVNTGWTGGPCGIGKRMPLKDTRAVLTAALEGSLDIAEFREDKTFGFKVPLKVEGVNSEILNPRDTWADPFAYDQQAKKLVSMFAENFVKFKDYVDESILKVSL